MQQLTSDRQEANWIPVTNNTLNGTDHTIGWLVGWGLTALLTQNRSYRACRFV